VVVVGWAVAAWEALAVLAAPWVVLACAIIWTAVITRALVDASAKAYTNEARLNGLIAGMAGIMAGYLPLSGGAMSGNISFNGSSYALQDAVWTNVGLTSGWANAGAGKPVLAVTKLPLMGDLMVVQGEIVSPAGGLSNPQTVGFCGASFQPATEQPLTVRFNTSGPTSPPAIGFLRCVLAANGNIVISGTASTTQVGFQIFGIISLSH
jgi:hypothetical protein